MQTRLTALDLIGYAAGDERPRQFVHMPEQELEQELIPIKVAFASSHRPAFDARLNTQVLMSCIKPSSCCLWFSLVAFCNEHCTALHMLCHVFV